MWQSKCKRERESNHMVLCKAFSLFLSQILAMFFLQILCSKFFCQNIRKKNSSILFALTEYSDYFYVFKERVHMFIKCDFTRGFVPKIKEIPRITRKCIKDKKKRSLMANSIDKRDVFLVSTNMENGTCYIYWNGAKRMLFAVLKIDMKKSEVGGHTTL